LGSGVGKIIVAEVDALVAEVDRFMVEVLPEQRLSQS
jgi:hypothetical protein